MVTHEGQKRALMSTILGPLACSLAALTTELSEEGNFVRIRN